MSPWLEIRSEFVTTDADDHRSHSELLVALALFDERRVCRPVNCLWPC